MKWFKHQTDARNSLKLRKIRRKYGADGYAIYWFCLEAIAYQVDKNNLTFDLKEDAETIGFELSIQERRVEEIMIYMVETGLFESSGGVITCLKLAESIDKSMTNSPAMRKWLDTKSVMTCVGNANACAELEKEKEKEKEKQKNVHVQRVDHSLNYQEIENIYHECLPNAPRISKLTNSRKKLIKKFFTDFEMDTIKLKNYLSFLASNQSFEWLFQTRPMNNGTNNKWQKKKMEYFFSEKCYLSAKEIDIDE